MLAIRFSSLAEDDLRQLLYQSEEQFGTAARQRYRVLLETAVSMIADDPSRVLSRSRTELGRGIRSWHIRNSRDSSPGGKVRNPRHVIFYRVDGDELVIGRVLDHVMEPALHVTDDMDWS